MRRLPPPAYALLRLAEAVLSSGSRFVNGAFLPGGSTSISVSARAALETSPAWERTESTIDAVFRPQTWITGEPHCQWSLDREAENAVKTLLRIAEHAAENSSVTPDALSRDNSNDR